MAPPRLQCLEASRHILNKRLGSTAMFSTSQVKPADDKPRPNNPSPADLIASLDDGEVPKRRSTASSPRDPFNSLQLPRHNARSHGAKSAGGYPGGAARVANLLATTKNKHLRRQDSAREAGKMSLSSADEMAKHKMGQDLSKQITRRWKAGDVYAPHDLSPVEMAKWKNRGRPVYDVFDVLDFKPAEHYRNFSIMSEYMTPMGRIKHSKETGLRPVNQRRIARAIRRSIGMGMMPSVHRHPEILQKVLERNEQISPFRNGPL